MKRVFDVVVASIAIVVLSPVIATTAILVRVLIGSPVIFRHARPGLLGKPFTMLKFRTMTNATDADGVLMPDGDRLTAFGRFLRKSSLDELPELFNVVRGEMSLVGPRPLLMEYLPLYSAEQNRRHLVRPGITGWAQINGRNASTWSQKFAHDIWYVDNQSFALDISILFRTIRKVIGGDGVSEPGHATARPFDGNV